MAVVTRHGTAREREARVVTRTGGEVPSDSFHDALTATGQISVHLPGPRLF